MYFFEYDRKSIKVEKKGKTIRIDGIDYYIFQGASGKYIRYNYQMIYLKHIKKVCNKPIAVGYTPNC